MAYHRKKMTFVMIQITKGHLLSICGGTCERYAIMLLLPFARQMACIHIGDMAQVFVGKMVDNFQLGQRTLIQLMAVLDYGCTVWVKCRLVCLSVFT